MFVRLTRILVLAAFALVPFAAFAQDDDPEIQDMRQQMQQVGMQVMQNMLQKGIDPRQFLGDVRQQMQEGTLDMAAFQQKLVDQGLIDKDTITQLQTTAQNATQNSIRRQLGVTDAEWAVLLPRIQRVIIAGGDTDNSNQMRNVLAGIMRGPLPKSDVTKMRQELQAAVKNDATTTSDLQAKLGAVREAAQKAKDELAAAQKDLKELLTVRQEAVLTMLGLL